MGKLSSPSHLCVFEGTALISVGFLHRCMADCEDNAWEHDICLLLYTGKGLEQSLQDDGKMVLLHICMWGN